jgi:cyclopropane-fatty-acyl-phospholipid synthase
VETWSRRLVVRLWERALRSVDVPVGLRLWDGTTAAAGAPGPCAFTVVLHSPAACRRLLVRPTALAFGEAFIAGTVDIEGDLFAAMRALHALRDRPPSLPWPRRRRRRVEAITYHYDVSNAFYELFLDQRMVYTCAYYRDPNADLDQAQADKLDLVCRKLRLAPGERLLDLGCGWGALVMWAAAHYGVRAHGVTLSAAQAEWAQRAIRRAGLGDRARVEHADYQELDGADRFEKIAAIGLIEHLGAAAYPAYFGRVHELLVPGGLFLNHGITNRHGDRRTSESEFLERHVFPGYEIPSVTRVQESMEAAGLEVLDVENLRPHYARTTRVWAQRLQARRAEALALVGERTYRIWVGYLAAASVAFESGWIGLHQIVGTQQTTRAVVPWTRESVYAGAVDTERPAPANIGWRGASRG